MCLCIVVVAKPFANALILVCILVTPPHCLICCFICMHRYTKEHLWNKGCRFLSDKSLIFQQVVCSTLSGALDITDVAFQMECAGLVGKWILSKQDDIINNVKSPYRAKLKTCKRWRIKMECGGVGLQCGSHLSCCCFSVYHDGRGSCRKAR